MTKCCSREMHPDPSDYRGITLECGVCGNTTFTDHRAFECMDDTCGVSWNEGVEVEASECPFCGKLSTIYEEIPE